VHPVGSYYTCVLVYVNCVCE